MTAKVSALLPWFGSKRSMAPRIVAQLGPHSAYWELFCGSMAVLLAKPPATMENVNDLHGDLINLARVIKDDRLGPALYRRLRRTLAAKALMADAAERLKAAGRGPAPAEAGLQQAEDYFLCSWLGINGVSGTASYNQGFCRRFTKNGGHAATRWTNAVQSIPEWRRRLRSVVVMNECGIGLADRIEDAAGICIYADPPYLVKGAKYVHDFDDADHVRLAAALNRFHKTRVVVSYYDHPRLAELYPSWTKIYCQRTKNMVSSGKRVGGTDTVAPEVLLINGPDLASSGLFGCNSDKGESE